MHAGFNCTVGNSCPLGATVPVSCSVGTMQDEAGQASCKSCAARGGYQIATGQTFCFDCPMNTFTVPSLVGGGGKAMSADSYSYSVL